MVYAFWVDVIIWSFAIYGALNFVNEIWLDVCCYIVKFIKKLLIKN